MPEVQARRRLGGRVSALSVLAPVGSFAGKGTLRVLRASFDKFRAGSEDDVALICGYEAYEVMK
jgi:hypothetical protein